MFQNWFYQNYKKELYKYETNICDIYLEIIKKHYLRLSKVFSLKKVKEKRDNLINVISVIEHFSCYIIELRINNTIVSIKKIKKNMLIQYIVEVINYLLNSNKNFVSFHASGLIIEKSLFLFVGSSGSGKTTALTYLLNKFNNSVFFSDDRVFINEELNANGLINALSIKNGTKKLMKICNNDLFGPFKKNNIENFWYYTVKNKKCNYSIELNKLQVIIISIKFNQNINYLEHTKLNNLETIKLLINNCYDISSNTKNAQTIIKNTLSNSNTYKITYSNLNELYLFINSLLEKNIVARGDE